MSFPHPAAPERLPSHTPTCMGCGQDNPHGLQLAVYREDDEVFADLIFDERHIGAPGLAHGGAIAAACDDVLGFSLWIAGTPAVTRTLSVEYLQPVPLNQRHRLTARIASRQGRAIHVDGAGVGDDGVTRFAASAVFIAVDAAHFAAHGDITGFSDLFTDLAEYAARRSETPNEAF